MATWLPYKTACVSIINVLVIDTVVQKQSPTVAKVGVAHA